MSNEDLTEEQAIAELEEVTENKDEESVVNETIEATIKEADKLLEKEFEEES